MLSQAWIRECRLPVDADELRRIVRVTTQEWRRAWPKVSRYWRKDGDAYVNDTQLAIYAEAKAMRERASERGRRGAQAVLKQRSSDAQASSQAQPEQQTSNAQAVLEHKPPSPSPSPIEDPPLKGAVDLPRARGPQGSGVGGGTFPRDHLKCAGPCGRICLPERLFEEFVRARGGVPDEAADYVRAWKTRVDAAWGDDGPHAQTPIGDDGFTFWRARWREDHGTTRRNDEATPTREASAAALKRAVEEHRERVGARR